MSAPSHPSSGSFEVHVFTTQPYRAPYRSRGRLTTLSHLYLPVFGRTPQRLSHRSHVFRLFSGRPIHQLPDMSPRDLTPPPRSSRPWAVPSHTECASKRRGVGWGLLGVEWSRR